MVEKIIVYKNSADKFNKRLWRLFFSYPVLYGLGLCPVFFNLDGHKPVIISWFILMLTCILIMFFSSYKWSLNKIILITTTADIFEIEMLVKNKARKLKIPIESLNYQVKWVGGRPRVLKLTLFDKNTKIADLYSGGREKYVQEIKIIKFSIDNHISVSQQYANSRFTPGGPPFPD